MSQHSAPAHLLELFREELGGEPAIVVRAPGRVSLLGGHVDYNEGWVMPAAIDRSIWLAARSRDDLRLRVYSQTMEECRSVSLQPIPAPPAKRPQAEPVGWMDYLLGVAWVLQSSGQPVRGLDAVLVSDLPAGAGVSSSAALEVAFLMAWQALEGRSLDRMELARMGQRVENDYLGVQSGIQDQFASLHGQEDHLLFLDCRDLHWQAISLPTGYGILVADSGVRRTLLEGGLNDRRAECALALEQLRASGLQLQGLRDLRMEQLEAAHGVLAPKLYRRARHVVEECARVRLGTHLLEAGKIEEFGKLMQASHMSSRDLYEVSNAELDTLAETAWRSPGCVGARLSGAGLGGCVVALVRLQAAAELESQLAGAFRQRFSRSPDLFQCRLSDGASVEVLD